MARTTELSQAKTTRAPRHCAAAPTAPAPAPRDRVGAARLGDIAAVFNLIQLGAASGHFNDLYLRPRYQAGLGLQLFSAWLWGRVRVPGGLWRRAQLQVLRVDKDFAGFALILGTDPAAGLYEIYMTALAPAFRAQGWGRRMLLAALDGLPARCTVQADSLPAAAVMKQLLRSLGFRPATRPLAGARAEVAQRFTLDRRAGE